MAVLNNNSSAYVISFEFACTVPSYFDYWALLCTSWCIACIHILLLNLLIAQICSEHHALSNWTDNDDPNSGNEGESNFPDEANSTDYDDPNSTSERVMCKHVPGVAAAHGSSGAAAAREAAPEATSTRGGGSSSS